VKKEKRLATPGQAATYAMNRIGFLEKEGRQLDAQLFLDLEAPIGRTKTYFVKR
jgi:hypothetical protein